ncbi:MAG TPA: hypothetical protein PKK00_14300 [Bacteroidales bacterium]|nr:hypothetical protein [Bacteroidales bacterium]HPS18370.1 hypothetical protein [Bacteroidales bacterium]
MRKIYSWKNNFPVKEKVFSLFLILMTVLVQQSCIKKDDFDFKKMASFEYSPNLVAPIIHTSLTMDDLLASNQLIHEDANNFLTLIYRTTVFSKKIDELIDIPNQTINTSINFSTVSIPAGDSLIMPTYTTAYTFNSSNGERFDSIFIKSGVLDFNINGDVNHNLKINVNIPGLLKNGQSFKKIINYNYTGSLPVTIHNNFDLSGYKLTFSSGNNININYDLTVYGDNNSDYSPYNLNMGESFTDIGFNMIFGFMGTIDLDFNQDSVDVSIFNNTLSGSIYLADPKVRLYLNNSLGLPINFTINTLAAMSSSNTVLVTPFVNPYPWQINYPSYSEIGQSKETIFTLDSTNSNIRQAVNISPQYFSCIANAQANPLPNNPLTDKNFVIDTSKISLDVEVEIPFHGSVSDYALQDTVDFSLSEDIEKIDWLIFRVNTLNGFPLDATMQIYFVDSLEKKIDSLLVPEEQVITSGVIGPAPDYKVVSPTHKLTTDKISHDRLMNMINVKKIYIYSKLETANSGNTIIKMYSDYNIDIKIGIQAQIKTTVVPSNND